MGVLDGMGKKAKQVTDEYNKEQELKLEQQKKGQPPTGSA